MRNTFDILVALKLASIALHLLESESQRGLPEETQFAQQGFSRGIVCIFGLEEMHNV